MTSPHPQDTEELKPWPFFGYAPGNYMATCRRCGEIKSDLDKRAISCLECAVIASKAYGRDQTALISELSTRPDSPVTVSELAALLRRLEPHLDAIICYASTMGEHEPNRLAVDVRATLAKLSQGSVDE